MWGFVDCTRYYMSFGIPKIVLDRASLLVSTTDKLGLLVPPGEGKSTIIRLLAGVDRPDSGSVIRDRGGWPLGYAGSLQPQLTGEENMHNMAMFVGIDPLSYSAFCAGFSELGDAYFQPLKLYTGRMRSQLAFAASLGMPATTYLADDKLAPSDPYFRTKCTAALADRLRTAGLIFVASNPRATEQVCERHAVVSRGKILLCESHEQAKELFQLNFEGGAADEITDEELVSFDLA